MKIKEALNIWIIKTFNPDIGLPQEIFYFINSLSSMVNVDLLIKNNISRGAENDRK